MTRLGVAVDVGNFALKAQFFDPRPDHRRPCGDPVQVPLRADDWQAQLARWQQRQLAALVPGGPATVHWNVASVNAPPAQRLRSWVEEELNAPRQQSAPPASQAVAVVHQWREITFGDVPLSLDVRQPQAVGIDRLIAGWAAWRGRSAGRSDDGTSRWVLDEASNKQRRPFVVIDAGSAVTIDLIDPAGTFRGGAILPGRQLQLQSLGRGAFALPDLALPALPSPAMAPSTAPAECPGRDTEAAIELGVFAGIIGAIRYLQVAYENISDRRPELILTGGDAALLAPTLEPTVHWVPNLVINGLMWL